MRWQPIGCALAVACAALLPAQSKKAPSAKERLMEAVKLLQQDDLSAAERGRITAVLEELTARLAERDRAAGPAEEWVRRVAELADPRSDAPLDRARASLNAGQMADAREALRAAKVAAEYQRALGGLGRTKALFVEREGGRSLLAAQEKAAAAVAAKRAAEQQAGRVRRAVADDYGSSTGQPATQDPVRAPRARTGRATDPEREVADLIGEVRAHLREVQSLMREIRARLDRADRADNDRGAARARAPQPSPFDSRGPTGTGRGGLFGGRLAVPDAPPAPTAPRGVRVRRGEAPSGARGRGTAPLPDAVPGPTRPRAPGSSGSGLRVTPPGPAGPTAPTRVRRGGIGFGTSVPPAPEAPKAERSFGLEVEEAPAKEAPQPRRRGIGFGGPVPPAPPASVEPTPLPMVEVFEVEQAPPPPEPVIEVRETEPPAPARTRIRRQGGGGTSGSRRV